MTSQPLTPARATTLAAAISVVHLVAPVAEGTCPADDGSVDTLTFLYPTGPDVEITVRLTGCQFVTNGIVIARFPPPELTDELSKLLATQN